MDDRRVGRFHWVLFALLGVACSDITEANESNFAAAINRDLAKEQKCVQLTLPTQIPVSDGKRRVYHPPELPLMDALVKYGLISTHQEDIAEEGAFWGKKEAPKHPYIVYELTDKGRQAEAKGKGHPFYAPGRTYLCYGAGEVKEVTNFTAPADVSGLKVSQAQYTYRVKNLADWAKAPEVASADQNLAAAARGDVLVGSAPLILTAKGWQTEREFNRARQGARASSE